MKSSLVTGPLLQVQDSSFSSITKSPSPCPQPLSPPVSYHGHCSACPDLHSTQSFQTFGSPVLVWPRLSLHLLGPHAILEVDGSYPAMLYRSTNMVLEKYKSVPPGIVFCCNQLLLRKESKENRSGQTGWTLEYNYTAEAIHK